MFVYSVRATTIRFFGVVCVALAALITLVAFVPTYTAAGVTVSGSGEGEVSQSVSYDKVKCAEDAAKFLEQFGWTVDVGSVQTAQVKLPAEFDKVFAGYNELQKRQGLNLTNYRNKTVTRYTFTVSNYPDADGTVYANVLVWRNRVIGGDLCSADVTGFVTGFSGNG